MIESVILFWMMGAISELGEIAREQLASLKPPASDLGRKYLSGPSKELFKVSGQG